MCIRDSPKEITADCRYMELNRQQQIISYHGCHICVINDNHWRNKTPFLRYIFSIFTYAKDMTDIWKSSPESFLSLTSYWTHLSRNPADTSLKANASNPVCGLSRYPTKVLSAFCSKYKDLSYFCQLNIYTNKLC